MTSRSFPVVPATRRIRTSRGSDVKLPPPPKYNPKNPFRFQYDEYGRLAPPPKPPKKPSKRQQAEEVGLAPF